MKLESRAKIVLYLSAASVVFLLASIFLTLVRHCIPSIQAFGWKMISGKTWDPVSNQFGALPFLTGTLLTSFLALLISIPFALAVSLFAGEYYPEKTSSSLLKTVIEVSAGIPSVIYGFWALFFLVPVVRSLEIKLGVVPYGVGIFTASLILSIMIIPYSASLVTETIKLVPHDLKEAAYSLGATQYDLIKKIILPYARSGIFAGVLLSLGRALGETMAVTMVIGNANWIPKSIFAPANTMASIIANEFTEAAGALHLSSLIEIGGLLFVVTTLMNIAGKTIITGTQLKAYG